MSTNDNNLNYDEILDSWHDKLVDKADKAETRADEAELGSTDYFKYKFYAKGVYDALASLSLEERKAKRKQKKEKENDDFKFNKNSSIENFFEEKHFYKIIRNLHKSGYSYREIAEIAEIPETYILKIVNLFKED